MRGIVLLACTELFFFSLDLAKCLGCIMDHSGQWSGGDAELVVTFNEFWLKCLVESIMMHER